MKPIDSNLAYAAARGDADAFAALLKAHYDAIFRLAFRLTGTTQDAEDLTQDICTALPAKLRSFRGEARFTTWLYRLVVNASHDRRRRAATHAKAASSWGDWEMNRRAELAETAQDVDWLTRAMTQLPEPLRDTLALVLDDVTHKDAADILGLSEGTVSWRISEARKHLRTLRETEEQI